MSSEQEFETAVEPLPGDGERGIFSIPALGHALRCWYLRTLLDHYLASAESEAYSARRHMQTVEYFRQMARAVQDELDALEA
ncbi:MAG: hypothetical protein ACJ72N_07535 [Labedaea sp.]|jgi:hypothetical protein